MEIIESNKMTLISCCSLFQRNKYMLFTGWEVRVEKYFVEVSKHIYSKNILSRSFARGRRPRDVFETETKYFSIRTDLNGK